MKELRPFAATHRGVVIFGRRGRGRARGPDGESIGGGGRSDEGAFEEATEFGGVSGDSQDAQAREETSGGRGRAGVIGDAADDGVGIGWIGAAAAEGIGIEREDGVDQWIAWRRRGDELLKMGINLRGHDGES